MPLCKPVWTPPVGARLPAGCRGSFDLLERSGTRVRDSAQRKDGSFVGSPTWGRGLYGPQLGGFTASNYVAIDPPNLAISYPFWQASLATNTSTTVGGYINSFGSSSSGNPIAALVYNLNSANTLGYFIRDNAGASPIVSMFSFTTQNDGNWHVAMGVSFSESDHRLYWDGVQLASSATAVGAITVNQLSLGVLRRTGVASPFNGSLGWYGWGLGQVPDPARLYRRLITGSFPWLRDDRTSAAIAATLGGGGGGGGGGVPGGLLRLRTASGMTRVRVAG